MHAVNVGNQPLYLQIYHQAVCLVIQNPNSLSQPLYFSQVYQRVVCLVIQNLNSLNQHLYSGQIYH